MAKLKSGTRIYGNATVDNNLTVGSETLTGTASQPLQVTGGAYVSGNVGIGTTNSTSKLSVVGDGNFTGIVTASSFSGNASSATYAETAGIATYATTAGIATYAPIAGIATYAKTAGIATNTIGGISSITQLQVTGISTFSNGPVFIGAATSTGTASQPLQVTGGAYVSGNAGIGTTNPQSKLHTIGTGRFTATSGSDVTSNAAIYADTPLQTVSAFFGKAASVTTLTGNQYSTAIRFNGTDVYWGDISYYPNQGGQGHFRFSLAGTSVNTTPDASVGVGSVYSTGQITSNRENSTTTGNGQIYLNGATGNRIDFNINGIGAPTFTTRSAGTKIVLYPAVSASSSDFALGIDSNVFWYSVDTTAKFFRWYAGTTNVATLTGGGNFSSTGTVSDANGNVRNIPQNAKTSAYILVATDVGKHISISTGGVTVPASVFAVGDVVTIFNSSASSQTITQGLSVTMYLAGTATTGNRTLNGLGLCTVLCVASNTFVISGAGLS